MQKLAETFRQKTPAKKILYLKPGNISSYADSVNNARIYFLLLFIVENVNQLNHILVLESS